MPVSQHPVFIKAVTLMKIFAMFCAEKTSMLFIMVLQTTGTQSSLSKQPKPVKIYMGRNPYHLLLPKAVPW